jgi:DNA-binding response OmpR family regulator
VGIDYFIVKPYEKQELLNKILELTRGRTRVKFLDDGREI